MCAIFMYEYWSSVKVNVHEMEKLLGAAEPQKFLSAKVSAFKVTNSYCTNQLFSWYYYQLLVSLSQPHITTDLSQSIITQSQLVIYFSTEKNVLVKIIIITKDDVKGKLKSIPDWKIARPDNIQDFWLKYFTAVHEVLESQLQV